MIFNGQSTDAKSKKKILDFLLAASNAEQIAVDGIAHAVDPEARVSALS